jgi:hypothetical protein
MHHPSELAPYRSVVVIIARSWGWYALFKHLASRNLKHLTRSLAWQYTAAEEPGTCAGARWGDASQHWLGEEADARGPQSNSCRRCLPPQACARRY